VANIQTIAVTLIECSKPGQTRKDLIAAVRKKHPHAGKKDIVRAAFYALSESSDAIRDKATDLHAFALSERGSDEHD
jgi:hypothetical protein